MGKLSFGTTGLSYQPDKVNVNVNGAPECPRCHQRVYFNEEKRALGKCWHARCFTCAKCKKNLDSTNCNGHEGDIYCTSCHKREFGPKGYGFAGGASGLSTESSIRKVRPVSPIQTQTVPSAIPSRGVDKTHPENCPCCGKRVYFAEEVRARGRKWHRLCFKCTDCNKILEPGRVNEHQMSLYCQACYGRKYGPKGYGFAGGAGNLLASEPSKLQISRSVVKRDVSPRSRGTDEWTEAVYV